MAKKDKEPKPEEVLKGQMDEVKNTTGDSLPADSAIADNSMAKAETEKQTDSIDDAKNNVIEPVAVDIRLRDIHPQESYGRCGLRFKKGETQRIAIEALEPHDLITLNDDPWLELIYVTEQE